MKHELGIPHISRGEKKYLIYCENVTKHTRSLSIAIRTGHVTLEKENEKRHVQIILMTNIFLDGSYHRKFLQQKRRKTEQTKAS